MEEKLREAACYGDIEGMMAMMDRGANVNAQHKINGYTALHWAAKRNNLQCVEVLLANGADKLIYASKGELPAHLTTDRKVLQTLGYSAKTKKPSDQSVTPTGTSKTPSAPSTTGTAFVPNYLKHPPLNHKIDLSKERQESVDSISKELLPPPPPQQQQQQQQKSPIAVSNNKIGPGVPKGKTSGTSNSYITQQDVRILKIRLIGQGDFDKDFIEIDIPVSQLGFKKLVDTVSEEFSIDSNNITKVRKLPNTKLRRDVEVQRLEDYQELEIEIKINSDI